MYLKSIEVQGFKSFANKMTLKFHNGITGIVGPNGSGKSNVADAVRWVLGEQRVKQLRGGSMQDVIFSGTEMRKPLSYAYVAITLDNSDHQLAIDYEEVTVSRRLYRSGESEYMINGTICRLKDVNELFYDTGIGKEGYSIIGQGQIDRILSGKPEERRELFDEAAGIVKFKRRKATTIKKLEEEKLNQVRVSDILSELEKQIGPLEKQSEKAKIYIRKKEALKNLDVNVFLVENRQIQEQLEEIDKNYQITEQNLNEAKSQYEKSKTEYEELEQEIKRLDQAIEEAQNTVASANITRSNLEGEIKVLQAEIASVEGNEEHLKNRIESIQADIEVRMAEKAKIDADKKEIDEKLSELENKREQAKSALSGVQDEIAKLDEQIEKDKNTIIEALTNRATIKSKMGRFDSMMEQINIRKAELNAKILRAKSDEAKQVETIKQLEEEFEQITEAIKKAKEEQTKKEQSLGTFRENLIACDEKLRTTQASYHQDKAKLESWSNVAERYDGYGGSVKAVMERKDSVPGIIGVVADIIHVDKKYEIAIETALGGNIQNVVTEDEDTAKEMIQYLKKNRAGRATFLPLTSITKPQEFKNPDALKEPGAIGMADELVEVEDRYRNVAKAMLGRIVVVDHVDHAVKIARKFDYGIRMVTLEGELLVPGGAISGGAYKNNSNLLGRRREIEELEKRVAKYKEEIDKLQNEIEEIKSNRNKVRLEIEQGSQEIQRKIILQNTARLNVAQAREKQGAASEGYDELKSEQLNIEARIKEIQLEKDEITNELSDSETLEKNLQIEISDLQKQVESLRENESDHSIKASSFDVEIEKTRQLQNFHKQNVERIEAEISRLATDLKEVQDGLNTGKTNIEEKRANILEIQKTIEASHLAQDEAAKNLDVDRLKKEQLLEQQKSSVNKREEQLENTNRLERESMRLSSQKERLESSIENQINYMWDEYEITLSDAASLRNEEMTDLAEMKRGISALKDEIRKLGDVNVNAIEAYKELMERYTFMKTQHDDLVEAVATLQGIIEELDKSMREQFEQEFKKINREFDKVFKELFGGGKGTLELIEDEDILEAGIRIIAQPPGKKLVNMMQMSGGEKALTAIALLFAIQNLKPSPFCLLDEIEAALDESNVSRFAGYLHKLTKSTQFIVITHRRGTMEKVDRLYGITMQEKGVSTLVSVNLIDKDLDD